MRLGVFGGTFDPVHLGHLIVAEAARLEAQLDRVLFVLSPRPPHKNAEELTPISHRLAMLNLALAENPHFAVSTLELERQGVSYTVDTLRQLKSAPKYVEAELHLIVGMDSLAAFAQWREPEAIIQLARLLVYPRSEAGPCIPPELAKTCQILDAPIIEISSTLIRSRLQEGRTVRYLVPASVQKYLEAHHLYC
ncbi:MAG: nicotinate-nucleotide adenylyltransferase [bacterium]